MIIYIAIAAIALSISVMILTTAMISGFKNEIHSKIFGFWGHIHITDTNINRDFELRPITLSDSYVHQIKDIKQVAYQKPIEVLGNDKNENYKQLKTKGGVRQVQPFIIMPGLLESKTGFEGVLFKGIDTSYDWHGMQRFITSGPSNIEALAEDEIVISKIIANKLDLMVNKSIILSFVRDRNTVKRKFTVAAIYNTGLEEYDKRFVIGNMNKIQELLGWKDNEVAGIEVFCDYIDDSPVINDYLYNSILPNNMYSERIQQKFPGIFEWLKLQDINEKVILQLMTIVAIINMMTVLLILILERSNMIGVLKAIGASNWSIQKIFLYYAAVIIGFGLLIGNAAGIGIALIQKHFKILKLDEANYYLDTAPIALDWIQIVIINAFVFLLIILFLIVPTFIINRVKTIDIIRFS